MLRVAVWDVRRRRSDRGALAGTLRRGAPDLVALTGAASGPRWRSRTAALAREAGLLYACGGPPAGGCVLLAAPRVDVRDTAELTFTSPGRIGRAAYGAALAQVRLVDAPASVIAAARLADRPVDRDSHESALARALLRFAEPVVVAGAGVDGRPLGIRVTGGLCVQSRELVAVAGAAGPRPPLLFDLVLD